MRGSYKTNPFSLLAFSLFSCSSCLFPEQQSRGFLTPLSYKGRITRSFKKLVHFISPSSLNFFFIVFLYLVLGYWSLSGVESWVMISSLTVSLAIAVKSQSLKAHYKPYSNYKICNFKPAMYKWYYMVIETVFFFFSQMCYCHFRIIQTIMRSH